MLNRRVIVAIIIIFLLFLGFFSFANPGGGPETIADTTAPVITLVAGDDIVLGGVFVEPGYSATDNVDGIITDKVVITGTVDTNTLGEYTLIYIVSDEAGNDTSVTKKVRVVS